MSPTNDSRSRVQMRDQIMAGENGEVYIYETDEANSVYAQQSRPPVLEMGNCGRKEPEPTTVPVANASKDKTKKRQIFE